MVVGVASLYKGMDRLVEPIEDTVVQHWGLLRSSQEHCFDRTVVAEKPLPGGLFVSLVEAVRETHHGPEHGVLAGVLAARGANCEDHSWVG